MALGVQSAGIAEGGLLHPQRSGAGVHLLHEGRLAAAHQLGHSHGRVVGGGDADRGSPRSNPDGSICLHARYIRFVHPVSKELIEVEAPVPPGNLWNGFETI